ncbi:MAG: SUMF1/EgtB/PvdO family nonheme iron enzyme [Victivallales bacterium]|nr:SUMF1/EgtB/PvdO family nonheme iron enzyme [Victivallales bacterium]
MNKRHIVFIASLFVFMNGLVAESSEMVKISLGSFMMGLDGPRYDEHGTRRPTPKHKVVLDQFYMDKYKVTQGDYENLMGTNPSATKERVEMTDRMKDLGYKPIVPVALVGENYPVTGLSWYDAAKYCNKRSVKEGLEPCYDEETWECDFTKNGYRLPTEAEWEYACRAGTDTKYFFGDEKEKLIEYANYWPDYKEWDDAFYSYIRKHEDTMGFVWDKTIAKLMPVGQKKPNPWGLYDILGNTWEWCNDWYDEDYYEKSPKDNPKGPEKGTDKVIRGCTFTDYEASSYDRSYHLKGMATIGFRCVRNAPKDEKAEKEKDNKQDKQE